MRGEQRACAGAVQSGVWPTADGNLGVVITARPRRQPGRWGQLGPGYDLGCDARPRYALPWGVRVQL